MSQFAGNQLTDALLVRLSVACAIEQADRAIVICTVDEHGWPHPALLSSLEIVAKDASNIRLTTHVKSRTTRNLKENGKLSLILVDQDSVFYIKGKVQLLSQMTAAPDHARFNMRVETVLEDNPAAHEEARLTSGIRVKRNVVDTARAHAILRELTHDD